MAPGADRWCSSSRACAATRSYRSPGPPAARRDIVDRQLSQHRRQSLELGKLSAAHCAPTKVGLNLGALRRIQRPEQIDAERERGVLAGHVVTPRSVEGELERAQRVEGA